MSPQGGELKVAVVGATGVVGSQIAEILGERGFPCAELKLFASDTPRSRSAEAAGVEHELAEFSDPSDLRGCDLAFLAVPGSVAADIRRAAPGPQLIDLSAAGRAPSGTPMIAPGLTSRERLAELRQAPVFEIPHPAAEAIASLSNALEVRRGPLGITVLMGASAWGRERVSELLQQTADLLNGRLDLAEDARQAAFNAAPDENEAGLAAILEAQVRELSGGKAPALLLRVVNWPLLHGTALTLFAPELDSLAQASERLRTAPGILLLDEAQDAGVVQAIAEEAIRVNLRGGEAGAALWCAFDNARRAALSALWVAESLVSAPSRKFN